MTKETLIMFLIVSCAKAEQRHQIPKSKTSGIERYRNIANQNTKLKKTSAYKINALAPSGIGFDTICDIEKNEIKAYKNFVEAYQILLERLNNQELGTEEHSKTQTSLNNLRTLIDKTLKNMIEFNIGSTQIVTVSVILSENYNVSSYLFFDQVDDLKMTKMSIIPSTFNEEAMTYNISSESIQVKLNSSALCSYHDKGQNLKQAVQSYLDIVFSRLD